MSKSSSTTVVRTISVVGIGMISFMQITGCNSFVPRSALTNSQREVYALNQQQNQITLAYNQSQQMVQSMTVEQQQLSNHMGQIEQQLANVTERLANVQGERSQLKARYVSMLRETQENTPLGGHLAERFRNLSAKYPNFEFDPETGASKFHSEILFASGSAVINKSAYHLLHDFGEIMNSEDAEGMSILIVGHTDSKDIIKRTTARRHATNWHLSTNRASAVAVLLSKAGLPESKIRVAGHSKFQPIASNGDESGRRLNRRVEIFVIAPQATIAGWQDRNFSRN